MNKLKRAYYALMYEVTDSIMWQFVNDGQGEQGRDRWNRTIGEVVSPSGQLLNHQLVREGLAWWFQKYAAGNEELHVMQEEARAAKRGVWVDANPVPPVGISQALEKRRAASEF